MGILLVVVGLVLMFASSEDPLAQSLSNLGVEMLGGAVIAFAFGWMQRRQEETAERQRLQLTLGLQKELTGISLAKADLAGFYLYGRTFYKADLSEASLTSAILKRANFTKARLYRANLFGRALAGHFTKALLGEAHLSANLPARSLSRPASSARFLRGRISPGRTFVGRTSPGRGLASAPSAAFALTEEGRKTVIRSYQTRKNEESHHRVIQQSLPLGLVPHVQARLLGHHLRGDLTHYPPFLSR